MEKIAILGLGDVAGHLLEFLCRSPGIRHIVTADIDEEMGLRKTNSAVMGAYNDGNYPEVEFHKLDMNNIDATASLLDKVKPTIVYNGATLQSWWVITTLPKPVYEMIDKARYGPWVPMHLKLTYKLMQAIRESGIKTTVVNSAFPDAVNPMLAKVGLAPAVGIGNLDNLTSYVKRIVSVKLGIPASTILPIMLGPHFVSYYVTRYGNSGGAPFYLKVMVGDEDVTDLVGREEILKEVTGLARRPTGKNGHPVVASSAAKIVKGIFLNTGEFGHAPGPNGLAGGYPVRLRREGVDVMVPKGMTLDEAIAFNEEGQKYDGIERIEEDGTAVLTDESAAVIQELLGYDGRRMTLADCDEQCEELGRRFKEFVDKHTK